MTNGWSTPAGPKSGATHSCACSDCDPPAPLVRNRFYPRKLMEVRHWQAEQDYHRRARQLLTRLSTGNGVLCGLEVALTEVGTLVITAGVAVDGQGRVVIVPEALEVDPSHLTGPATANTEPVSEGSVTISVAYRECGTEPAPLPAQSCDGQVRSIAGMALESYCVQVSTGRKLPVDLPESVCKALGGGPDLEPAPVAGAELDTPMKAAEESTAQDAADRRALLNQLAPPVCECAADQVDLAWVTFTNDGRQLDTSPRRVIRSNRELLDLILCLAARMDECCHPNPQVATPPRITALWPLPESVGSVLPEFLKSRRIEIAFDQPMAQQGLDAPADWLGAWMLTRAVGDQPAAAIRLEVTRSGAPLSRLSAPAGGDAAAYEVDLPKLTSAEALLVMLRSSLTGAIRAAGTPGLALDPELAATSLTVEVRDALWAVEPGQRLERPQLQAAPVPPLPSGNGAAGGDLHFVLSPSKGVVLPPRLLAIDPPGGASDADWERLIETSRFALVTSLSLAQEALDRPDRWLRLWCSKIEAGESIEVEELKVSFAQTTELDDGTLRHEFAVDGMAAAKDRPQLLWQLRSGPAIEPGSPVDGGAGKRLLDADFSGTALDSQTLFALWSGTSNRFPAVDPQTSHGQQLWDNTAGGLAHWGLTPESK